MKNINNKIDICLWFSASRSQRATEVSRGQGLDGTNGQEKTGCYECNGYNTACKKYTPNNLREPRRACEINIMQEYIERRRR